MRRTAMGEKKAISRRFATVLVVAAAGFVSLVAGNVASGAVAGSKVRISEAACTTSSCQITMTMTGVVKVTPTGTVDFLLGSSVIESTGGPCVNESMTPKGVAKASATCTAAGLPPGSHRISVAYSGDNYFDPSTTTRSIMVKRAV